MSKWNDNNTFEDFISGQDSTHKIPMLSDIVTVRDDTTPYFASRASSVGVVADSKHCLSAYFGFPESYQATFSPYDSLDGARNAFRKLKSRILSLTSNGEKQEDLFEKYQMQFKEALGSDLNTSFMLTVLYDVLKDNEMNDYTKRILVEAVEKYCNPTAVDFDTFATNQVVYGRIRTIPELENKNYMIRSSGERMALNTPIQGTAADILKKAMVEIYDEFNKRGLKSKMLIQVHDELVFNVLKSELEEVKEIVRNIMENTFKLTVPLKVDIEYGSNWYEAK